MSACLHVYLFTNILKQYSFIHSFNLSISMAPFQGHYVSAPDSSTAKIVRF